MGTAEGDMLWLWGERWGRPLAQYDSTARHETGVGPNDILSLETAALREKGGECIRSPHIVVSVLQWHQLAY